MGLGKSIPARNESNFNFMNKGIGLALLGVGIVLIVFGIHASDSVGSGISRFFTGTPTDKSMWLLVGGIAVAIFGGIITLRPGRS